MTDAAELAGLAPALEQAAAAYVRDQGLAGAAVGLVVGDRLAWSSGLGVADLVSGRPADARTLFRIGSISKTFAATAVVQLRDRGLLALDEPAVRHVPELAHADGPPRWVEEITIRHLLQHTSGLAAQLATAGTDTAAYWPQLSTATALAHPERIRVTDAPGALWRYSGIGYRLLGLVVERVTGRPYWEVLQTQILDPLGMTATGPSPDGELLARCAIGYDRTGGADRLDAAPPMDSAWFVASGELWSSVEDLARWASAQLAASGSGSAGGPEILLRASLQEMHRQTVAADESPGATWGLGWAGELAGGRRTVGHSGSLPGFVAFLDLCLAEGVGAISLFNGPIGRGRGLNEQLLDLALPVIARGKPPVSTLR